MRTGSEKPRFDSEVGVHMDGKQNEMEWKEKPNGTRNEKKTQNRKQWNKLNERRASARDDGNLTNKRQPPSRLTGFPSRLACSTIGEINNRFSTDSNSPLFDKYEKNNGFWDIFGCGLSFSNNFIVLHILFWSLKIGETNSFDPETHRDHLQWQLCVYACDALSSRSQYTNTLYTQNEDTLAHHFV